MAFTRFSTSEPWDPASGARLNKLGDELQEQINVLEDSKVNKNSYFVEDFNNIGSNERFLRSGANTPNAPSIGQFTGVRGVWDSDFDFVVGADISGAFWIRNSKEPWKQIATTTTWKSTSTNLANGWSAWGGVYYPVFTRNGNLVTVSNGCIGGGTITTGTIILTGIPIEFRPNGMRLAVLKHITGAMAMAIVGSDGTIMVDASWGGAWLSTGLYDMNFSYYLV